MAKTVIDLDEDALALVMAHYGTTVKWEAVNCALRHTVRGTLAGSNEAGWNQLTDNALGHAYWDWLDPESGVPGVRRRVDATSR